MRSLQVFSAVLCFIALVVEVSASPSLVGRARAPNGCSASNNKIFSRTVKHKEYFCQWWLSATRNRSPFIELLASEVTAVCYCIGTPATNDKRSLAATDDSSLLVERSARSDCRAELSSEFTEPRNFCSFYTRVPRASSPFKKFSVADLLRLCDCIEGNSVTTSSSATSMTLSSSSSLSSSITTSSGSAPITTSSNASSASSVPVINSTTIATSSSALPNSTIPSTSASTSAVVSSTYGNGTSGVLVIPTITLSTYGSLSTYLPVNTTSVISSNTADPAATGASSGFSASTGFTGAPYGNSTSSTIFIDPTVPIGTGISSSSVVPVNSTSSAISSSSVIIGPINTGPSSGIPSYTTGGAPYGNGTSTRPPVGPTGTGSSGSNSSTAVPVNSTTSAVTSIANSTNTAGSTGFPSSIITSGAPYGNGTSSMVSVGPTVPVTTAVSTNSTANSTTSAVSSGFPSSIITSGAPYGNGTSSTVSVGPTAPVTTAVSSSAPILTNSSTSAILTTGPSSGFPSSVLTSGAPYGNATSTILTLGPTVPVSTANSSTSSVLSISLPTGPVPPITTGGLNGTSSAGSSTVTTSSSTSTDLSTTTSSLAISSSSSATSSQSSSVPTSTQGVIRSGSRVFIDPQSPAFANRALESRQDGQNEYATVYTGRRQPPTLGYTFNETSGYLYLGNSSNVLSYEIPGFRSDSVQLATLTQAYLTAYPSSWSPLKCSVTEATGELACAAVSRSTRYRPSVTYSVFVAVPRSGQAAADIYLYAENGIDGRPLGAIQVPFFLSTDGEGWP